MFTYPKLDECFSYALTKVSGVLPMNNGWRQGFTVPFTYKNKKELFFVFTPRNPPTDLHVCVPLDLMQSLITAPINSPFPLPGVDNLTLPGCKFTARNMRGLNWSQPALPTTVRDYVYISGWTVHDADLLNKFAVLLNWLISVAYNWETDEGIRFSRDLSPLPVLDLTTIPPSGNTTESDSNETESD